MSRSSNRKEPVLNVNDYSARHYPPENSQRPDSSDPKSKESQFLNEFRAALKYLDARYSDMKPETKGKIAYAHAAIVKLVSLLEKCKA